MNVKHSPKKVTLSMIKGKSFATSVPAIHYHASDDELEELYPSTDEEKKRISDSDDPFLTGRAAVPNDAKSSENEAPKDSSEGCTSCPADGSLADGTPPSSDPWKMFSEIKGKITKTFEEKLSKSDKRKKSRSSRDISSDSEDVREVADENGARKGASATSANPTRYVGFSRVKTGLKTAADEERVESGIEAAEFSEDLYEEASTDSIVTTTTTTTTTATTADVDTATTTTVGRAAATTTKPETTDTAKTTERIASTSRLNEQRATETSVKRSRPETKIFPSQRANDASLRLAYRSACFVALTFLLYYFAPLPEYVLGICIGALGTIALSSAIGGIEPSEEKAAASSAVLEIPAAEEHSVVERFEGWLNELPYAYDSTNYHVARTKSVYFRLEGDVLRIMETRTKIPKRAVWDEPKHKLKFSRCRTYSMVGAKVELLPQGLIRRRRWSKKYPICVTFKPGALTSNVSWRKSRRERVERSKSERSDKKSRERKSKDSEAAEKSSEEKRNEDNSTKNDVLLNDRRASRDADSDRNNVECKNKDGDDDDNDYYDNDDGDNEDDNKGGDENGNSDDDNGADVEDDDDEDYDEEDEEDDDDGDDNDDDADSDGDGDGDVYYYNDNEVKNRKDEAYKGNSGDVTGKEKPENRDERPTDEQQQQVADEDRKRKNVSRKYTFHDCQEDETKIYIFARADRQKEDWYRRLVSSSLSPTRRRGGETWEYYSTLWEDSSAETEGCNVVMVNHHRHSCDGTAEFRQAPKHTVEAHSSSSSSSSSNEIAAAAGDATGDSVLWLNCLMARILFDMHDCSETIGAIQERIQRKLSNIKLPYFMEGLLVSEVTIGQEAPVIRKVTKPMCDERGVWFDVDTTYRGSLTMTVETKLNLMKLTTRTTTSDGATATATGSAAEGERSPRSPIFDSDVEDTPETSTEDEDDSGVRADGTTKETTQSSGKKLLSMVDKLAANKYFQHATELSYVRRAMEGVSKTEIRLTVSVSAVEGRVSINIPPPPSDRVWYGFKGVPRVKLTVKPALGERTVNIAYVTKWIEAKLLREVEKLVVMPNMDDIVLPFCRNYPE